MEIQQLYFAISPHLYVMASTQTSCQLQMKKRQHFLCKKTFQPMHLTLTCPVWTLPNLTHVLHYENVRVISFWDTRDCRGRNKWEINEDGWTNLASQATRGEGNGQTMFKVNDSFRSDHGKKIQELENCDHRVQEQPLPNNQLGCYITLTSTMVFCGLCLH